MPLIRKDTAGNDSRGHTWAEDGAVVEMPHEEAEELLAIPDGGFTLVAPSGDDEPVPSVPEPEPLPDVPEPNPQFSEVNPDEDAADEPGTKTPAKKAAPRKPAARKTVEEG
jgi:hypothetical protein